MLGDLDGHEGRQLRGSRYADNPELGQAAPLVHLGRQHSVPARHFRHIRSRRRRLRQHRKLLLDIKPAPSLYAPQQLDRRVRHRSCAIASSSSKPASRILTPPPQGGPHRRETLRALEDENGRLKRMLAETMLDNAALKD